MTRLSLLNLLAFLAFMALLWNWPYFSGGKSVAAFILLLMLGALCVGLGLYRQAISSKGKTDG